MPGRAEGLFLSEKGVAQAEAAARAVLGSHSNHKIVHKIVAVYSSPMERAQQTAAAFAKASRRQVRIHPGLNECDFGSWTGKYLARLRKLSAWQQVQRTPSNFRFPSGESFAEMQNRMVATLLELARQHKGKTIVAVSHADTIKVALTHALGMHLDMFQRLHISPASVSTLVLGEGQPTVASINSVFPP